MCFKIRDERSQQLTAWSLLGRELSVHAMCITHERLCEVISLNWESDFTSFGSSVVTGSIIKELK